MSDADTIDVLTQELYRLRELVSVMAEHGEQTVCYLTIAFDGSEKVNVLITHANELAEHQFVALIGEKVKPILEGIYAAAESWRPIETAPKTRRAILLYCSGNQCCYTAAWHEWLDAPGWRVFGGHDAKLAEEPTHWMPLPETDHLTRKES